jgi:hypothetical protein
MNNSISDCFFGGVGRAILIDKTGRDLGLQVGGREDSRERTTRIVFKLPGRNPLAGLCQITEPIRIKAFRS